MKPDLASTSSIYIILSTFEGIAHVREQVESILAQSHRDWRMLVRDDGSNDGTIEQLEDLVARDDRIEIISDGLGQLGANGSFSLLMEEALRRGADWVAISDQDDVWKPEKLALQIDKLNEANASPDECVLLHSDLAVVGPDLEPIHPSLHGTMRLRHESSAPLATLLVQNFVTGCTCIASRALLERALPVPSDAIVYDWWLALCAGSYGRILFDPESTVLYRQHPRNLIGVKPYPRTLMRLVARTLAPRRHAPDEFVDTIRQACALERHLANLVTNLNDLAINEGTGVESLESCHDLVSEYVAVYRSGISRFRRVRELSRLRIHRQDPILNLSLKLNLLLKPIILPRDAKVAEVIDRGMRRHAGSW